jgi:hypothetical protein
MLLADHADTFPIVTVAGKKSSEYQYVRMPKNHYTHGGISDVNSRDMRCFQDPSSIGKTSVVPVAAGSNVTFTVEPNLFHPGPLQYYMAAAPKSQDLATWEPSGKVWFKIEGLRPIIADRGLKWPMDGIANTCVQSICKR